MKPIWRTLAMAGAVCLTATIIREPLPVRSFPILVEHLPKNATFALDPRCRYRLTELPNADDTSMRWPMVPIPDKDHDVVFYVCYGSCVSCQEKIRTDVSVMGRE